jgi:hypothetical protein
LLLYYCYYVITTHNEGAKVVPSAHNGAAVDETRWRGLQESVAADTARIKGLRRPVSLASTAVLVGAWLQTHSVTKQWVKVRVLRIGPTVTLLLDWKKNS